MRVHIDPPGFARHEKANRHPYTHAVDVEIDALEISTDHKRSQ